MKTDSIDWCLRISLAHASLSLKLDDELGTFHGLSLADFIVLRQLSQAPDGHLPMADLVRPLGLRPSAVMRMLLPLEKTGLVQRESSAGSSSRGVAIRPAGKRVLQEALVTAEQVCKAALAQLPADALPLVASVLSTMCRTDALAV
ncbi:MAG: MarR family transcriptional regulator [Rubrivivax sp.]